MRISDWSSTCALPIWPDVEDTRCGRSGRHAADLRGRYPDRRWPALPSGQRADRTDHDGHVGDRRRRKLPLPAAAPRSEEHTSELQSLMRISYAVFCLKKKNITMIHTRTLNSIHTIHIP